MVNLLANTALRVISLVVIIVQKRATDGQVNGVQIFIRVDVSEVMVLENATQIRLGRPNGRIRLHAGMVATAMTTYFTITRIVERKNKQYK